MSKWAAGDMAVCISSGNWHFLVDNNYRGPKATGPRPGQLLTVRAVGVNPFGIQGLWFDEFPGNDFCDGYEARYFMRIPPEELKDETPRIKELEDA